MASRNVLDEGYFCVLMWNITRRSYKEERNVRQHFFAQFVVLSLIQPQLPSSIWSGPSGILLPVTHFCFFSPPFFRCVVFFFSTPPCYFVHLPPPEPVLPVIRLQTLWNSHLYPVFSGSSICSLPDIFHFLRIFNGFWRFPSAAVLQNQPWPCFIN